MATPEDPALSAFFSALNAELTKLGHEGASLSEARDAFERNRPPSAAAAEIIRLRNQPFTLTIHTDNAAFEEGNRRHELARILRDLADRLEDGGDAAGHLRDINGNTVGVYSDR